MKSIRMIFGNDWSLEQATDFINSHGWNWSAMALDADTISANVIIPECGNGHKTSASMFRQMREACDCVNHPLHCVNCGRDFTPDDKSLDLPTPVCPNCGSIKTKPNTPKP